MYPDFGPNIPAWFTETRLSLFGVKFNGLVVVFALWALGYFAYKFKTYRQLRQAKTSLRQFANILERDNESANTGLIEHVQDYFQQIGDGPGHSLDINIQLKHAWKEFQEGIQPCPKGSSQLYNVYQADDFFTADLLIKPFVLPLSHASGLYTSTGLLFTFVALGAGMSSLIYQGAGLEIKGLDEFINALSGKFVTSILGLGIALMVDWLIRHQKHDMEDALADIVYGLNRRVKRLTSQSILTEMNASVKALPEQIQTILLRSHHDEGIMAQLKETIEASLKGLIEEHVETIRKDLAAISGNLSGFGEDGAAQLTEVMKQLGPELREAISSGISGDISQLTNTLASLPKIMADSQANLEKLQQNMAASQAMMLDSVKELLSNVTAESRGSLEGVLRQLQESSTKFQTEMLAYQAQQQDKNRESLQALTDMLTALRARQAEQSSQLDASMAQAIERLETSLEQAQQNTSQVFATLQAGNAQLLEQMRDTLQASGTSATQQLQQQQALTQETLSAQRGAMQEELAALRESLLTTQREAQQELVSGVTQLFETQSALLNPLLSELQKSFKGFEQVGEALPNRIRETEQAISAAMEQLRTFMQQQMEPFVAQASQLTQDQQRLTGEQESRFAQLQGLQQSLMQGQATLDGLVTQLTGIQRDLTANTVETTGTLARHNELIAGCIERLKETRTTLDTEYERLHELSKSIAQTYGAAGSGLTEAIGKMQDNARGFYGELAHETGNLTAQLNKAITGLAGAIGDFEDALESFKGKQ